MAIHWRWGEADPFGLQPPNENPSGLGALTFNLRMPGQYYDRESNLFYNYYWEHDPQLGRYVQSDPIGLAGGENTYEYAASNPVVFSDPNGEVVSQLVGFAIGADLEVLTNPCASVEDILFAGGIGALGGGLSKMAFLRLGPKSLTRETGLEWSYSVARRHVDRYTSGSVNKFLN